MTPHSPGKTSTTKPRIPKRARQPQTERRLQRLRGELQAAFAGKDLPPAELNLAGDYGDAKLQNIDLTLATLGGSARYQGEADLSGAPAWRGTLDISGINGKTGAPTSTCNWTATSRPTAATVTPTSASSA